MSQALCFRALLHKLAKLATSRMPTIERFIVDQYGRAMESLGFLSPGFEDTRLVRSDEKNLLLYRLVLYSRHPLGKEFWQQVKKYSQSQQKMF